MPSHVQPTQAASSTRKKSSTAARLVQAAALAAVLVPLGSVAMEATTISCGFSGYASDGSNGGDGCSFSFGDRNRFNFGNYALDLEFVGLDPFANFDVSVTDNPMTQGEFSERATAFSDYVCIPLEDGGPCRDFVVLAPHERQWDSYLLKIVWDFDTNSAFPNEPVNGQGVGQVRMLHNPSSDFPNNSFLHDMCLEAISNGSYEACTYYPTADTGGPDPGIRSGDTVFSSFTVAWTANPVPEPASLILVGTGAGFLVRRYRRKTH
jgi:hypothetical protein